MTIKFLKQWGVPTLHEITRHDAQRLLDGGARIERDRECVAIINTENQMWNVSFLLSTPVAAVKFAAALNKLRRPLHLIKKDLDEDWARRVKERDNNTCALCGIQGDKAKGAKEDDPGSMFAEAKSKKRDVLTAHHWLKTKSRAGMARWSRACGVTVHFAEHIHILHENPCWMDLDMIYGNVLALEGAEGIASARLLASVTPTESTVRALWLERVGNKTNTSREARYPVASKAWFSGFLG